MLEDVCVKVIFSRSFVVTQLTLMSFLRGVSLHVPLQITLIASPVLAGFAPKRPLSSVLTNVNDKKLVPSSRVVTEFAFERPFIRVGPLMLPKSAQLAGFIVTQVTVKGPLTSVLPHVNC